MPHRLADEVRGRHTHLQAVGELRRDGRLSRARRPAEQDDHRRVELGARSTGAAGPSTSSCRLLDPVEVGDDLAARARRSSSTRRARSCRASSGRRPAVSVRAISPFEYGTPSPPSGSGSVWRGWLVTRAPAPRTASSASARNASSDPPLRRRSRTAGARTALGRRLATTSIAAAFSSTSIVSESTLSSSSSVRPGRRGSTTRAARRGLAPSAPSGSPRARLRVPS